MNQIPIFVDTNVFLHITDYKMNLEEVLSTLLDFKYKLFVHYKVEEELIELLGETGKMKKQARFAIQLMQKYEVFKDPEEYLGTDIALLLCAKNNGGMVFTFDKELKNRCISEKVPVISQYKKGRLRIDGNPY